MINEPGTKGKSLWASNRAFCREKRRKMVQSFGFTFRFIHDILSLNNSKFGDYVDGIYPFELEITDTTKTEIPGLTPRN